MRKPRALILSPFATAPLDAGQRLRAYQSTKMFQDLGYEITFLLYAFENQWYWKAQPRLLQTMLEQWGDVRLVYSDRQVSQPPKTGGLHHLDEWWDPEIGRTLERMLKYEDFDIFIVHNVWLSKALDFAPARTIKIIDTHDIFSTRKLIFEKANITPEFFLVDQNGERFGLSRSDIALTIKPQERDHLLTMDVSSSVINLPYAPPSSSGGAGVRDYRHKDKVTFGFLGTAHSFNKAGLQALLIELDSLVRDTLAPVELKIAGNICDALNVSDIHLRPIRLGYVADEAQFYEDVDVAIVPVFSGTGFKIKVAELAQMGKPMLCAEHAAEGVALSASEIALTPREMATKMISISQQREALDRMHKRSAAAGKALAREYQIAKVATAREIARVRKAQYLVLPLGPMRGSAAVQMMAYIIQARASAWSVWTHIVVPEEWGLSLESLNSVAAQGLDFCSSKDINYLPDEVSSETVSVTYDVRHSLIDDAQFRGLSPSRARADLRFADVEDLDETGLRNLGMATALLFNHRQSDIAQLVPLRRGQEFFCAPVVAWEATWDPTVSSIVRQFLRRHKPVYANAIVLHTGIESGRAIKAALMSFGLSDVRTFDTDIEDDVDQATASLLRAIFQSGDPFQLVVATPRASWLQALCDHGAAMNGGRTFVSTLSDFLRAKPLAGAGSPVNKQTRQAATAHVYGEMQKRLNKKKEQGAR